MTTDDELTESERQAHHGLAYAELARALALDLGSVKSRPSRAQSAARTRCGGLS